MFHTVFTSVPINGASGSLSRPAGLACLPPPHPSSSACMPRPRGSRFEKVFERFSALLSLREPPRGHGWIPLEILAQLHPRTGPRVDLTPGPRPPRVVNKITTGGSPPCPASGGPQRDPGADKRRLGMKGRSQGRSPGSGGRRCEKNATPDLTQTPLKTDP